MPDYQQGKINKIFNTITDDIYIGSTTQLLCNRMKNHRHNMSRPTSMNNKLYTCFNKYGADNFYIELVEKHPCLSKEELLAKDGYWIRKASPSLNTQIAGRKPKDYYQDNKEHILKQVSEWLANNKERYAAKKKEHTENNKERISEYHKQWRNDNKEKIKEHKSEHVKCECGCMIARDGMARHKRTRRHIDIMDTNA